MKTEMMVIIILVFGIFVIMCIEAQKSSTNINQYNSTEELKFITVGDPQINSSTFEGIERLKQVIDFTNKSDVDFIVFMGDMTDDGTNKSNDIVKDILKGLKKPYYVVIGNHDIYVSQEAFESYYGPMERIEKVKGYQLLFIGMTGNKDKKGDVTKLNWSFDFSKADKNMPTLVFVHGPVKNIATGCLYCRLQKDIIGYAHNMTPELDEFANLIGVYSGHVHYDSNQVFNRTRYVTVNGLINIKIMNIPIARPSDNVGYSVIKDSKSYYELVHYM